MGRRVASTRGYHSSQVRSPEVIGSEQVTEG